MFQRQKSPIEIQQFQYQKIRRQMAKRYAYVF